MRRRDFIIFAGTGVSWSLAAHAQQATISRIGVLLGLPEGDPEAEKWIQALVEGLSQLGWKRDKNTRIDLRWVDDPTDAQQRAKELINLRPDLLQVTTTVATAAVLRETRTIPVVFSNVSDPIGSGFVESFARPGGNATGFVNIENTVAGKWLGIAEANRFFDHLSLFYFSRDVAREQNTRCDNTYEQDGLKSENIGILGRNDLEKSKGAEDEGKGLHRDYSEVEKVMFVNTVRDECNEWQKEDRGIRKVA
jgi:ABC transporter substrate binding protein